MRTPEAVHPAAPGLRPVRFHGEDGITSYTPTFFDKPFAGTEVTLARMQAFGMFADPNPDLLLDVLDSNGDIVQDFRINRKGFEYLRRVLGFRVESTTKEPT